MVRSVTIRERQENLERSNLSAYAKLSALTRGRQFPIIPCDIRTDFQRDRDRIIHCKSFRRLKYKTQVFLSPEGDHYRTRLTHTLEVSQIARTLARALQLNEDLAEAIALGHDLGHTPFGHVGEMVLDEMLENGFEHNAQSLRMVEKLENGVGLNLTWEVRDGIFNHKKDCKASTLEGKIVSYADRIAYINHDIDDAIRAQILSNEDLPKNCVEVLGGSHGTRINNMILDIIKTSENSPFIRMSALFEETTEQLRDFMFKSVYIESAAKQEEDKAKHVVETLFDYYLTHLEILPDEFTINIKKDGKEVVAADYIACMTDRFAIRTYENLYVPKVWSL